MSKPKPASPVTNWSRLEDRIRKALKTYRSTGMDPYEALQKIDDAIGEETGRGWELT